MKIPTQISRSQVLPFVEKVDAMIRAYARGDDHLEQTYALFQLFLSARYLQHYQDLVTQASQGASAARVPVRWIAENELVVVFSSQALLRIPLKNLFVRSRDRRIGLLEWHSIPIPGGTRIHPATEVTLYANDPSPRSLSDIVLGLLFWCQHEYALTSLQVQSTMRLSESGPLKMWLSGTLYWKIPALKQVVFSWLTNKRDSSDHFREIKQHFQEELRENPLLKASLTFFRAWPSLVRIDPRLSDRHQAMMRHLENLSVQTRNSGGSQQGVDPKKKTKVMR